MLLQHSIIKFPFNFINAKIQTICTFPLFLILIWGLFEKAQFLNGFSPLDIFKPNSYALILCYLIKKRTYPFSFNLPFHNLAPSYTWSWTSPTGEISCLGKWMYSKLLSHLPLFFSIPCSVTYGVLILAHCPSWVG